MRTTFGYDGLTRRETVTDPRTGTTETNYNALGQVKSVEDADSNLTSYEYYDDQSPMAGRLKSQTNALNPGKTQYFEYSDRGELLRTWGDTTYPVEYAYDALGRRTELHTFRTGTAWDDPDWSTAVGSNDPDETTWVYEPGTGLLLEKQYDNHTPQDPRNIAYEYTASGQLWKRIWSRPGSGGNRVTTAYTYDDDTGELTDIDYYLNFASQALDPDTPGVSFTYDRLGRQATVNDAVGTRTFTYRDNVSTDGDLQLKTEDIVAGGSGLYSRLITRLYETGGNAGRSAGFEIGNASDTDADYKVSYGHEAYGRFYAVQGPGIASGVVTYDYHVNSDLAQKIAFRDASLNIKASVNFDYEDYRDLVESVENMREASPTPPISKYAYVNDAVGRRTSVVMTGSAFSSDRLAKWGYNTRSELTSADRHQGTDPQNPGQLMTPGAYAYDYDPIGNRTQATKDSAATYYCANALNQYVTLDDTDDTCPQNPADESFDYDADGNLTQDGQFDYTWDGENRLIRVETRLSLGTPSVHDDDDVKLEFTYDYMNRRVQKKSFVWDTGDWELETDLRFVYDQWNVVLVLDDAEDVLTKYTWGLDLSGQRGNSTASGIHGAGGIGGLLAVEETATSGTPKYWFFYDANGNVGQVVENTTNYPVAAHYEYDAYGNAIVADDVDSSGYVDANPFRFSTKWFDEESGFGNWGYRYYAPERGRWLNPDPLGELGGPNSYSYVENRASNTSDPAGLLEFEPTTQCKYQCGQCYNKCREQGGTVEECEGRWSRCHWSCRTSGIVPGECDEPPPSRQPPAPSSCTGSCSPAGTVLVWGSRCRAVAAGTPIPHDDVVTGVVVCACVVVYIVSDVIDAPKRPKDDPCRDDYQKCLMTTLADDKSTSWGGAMF